MFTYFLIAILSCLQTVLDVHKVTKVEQKCSFVLYYVFYCCMTSGNIILMSFFYHY